MTFCPECGSELKGDAHFCNNCGSKIGIDNVKEETPKNDIKKPKTKNKKISIIALISIAGLLIILLLYILSPVNVDEKNEGQSENKRPIADAGGDKIYYINQLGGISAGFNGSSSTDEDISSLTYEWDFGEGDEKEYGILTYNTYTKYGTYNVTLKVIDKYGLNDTDTIKISILQSIELNVLNHGYTYQNNSDDEYYDE